MNNLLKNKKIIILIASAVILIAIAVVSIIFVNKNHSDNPAESSSQAEQIDENSSTPSEASPESSEPDEENQNSSTPSNSNNNTSNSTSSEPEMSDEEIENALKEAMENTDLKLTVEDKGDTVVATFLENSPILPGQVQIVYNYNFVNGAIDNILVEYKLNDKELAKELYEDLTSSEIDDSFYNVSISSDGTIVKFNESTAPYVDMSKEQLINELKKLSA